MELVYDFWSLLKEYEIKIPIVQRDYAQGRNTAFVEEIRNNFLQDIYSSIINDKELNLDFIYGSIKQNNYSNRKIFLPLDGQQRLTTLFLLHWYLTWKDGIIHEYSDIRTILSGFKYETRISSREFCDAIVNQNTLIYSDSMQNVSEQIKNEAWFFSSWTKDPTIISMLNMLDSINRVFKNTTGLGTKLISKENNIKFRFIKLEKFGLDDSLYIKMNARGKLLTPFENFKANIEKKLTRLEENGQIDKALIDNISIKFDTKWADLLWKYREEATNVYDEQFLNLIQTLISYYAFIKNDEVPKIGIGSTEGDFFSHKDYIEYIDLEFIIGMEKILDFITEKLISKSSYLDPISVFDDEQIFSDIINRENVSNSKYIKFYGYCLYIINNEVIVKEEFEDWMRVVANLSENQIYNRLREVQNSIKSLLALSEHSSYILKYLSENESKITGFFRSTVEEEKIKAKLILKSDDWKTVIFKAENHTYFKGQIMFLLDFSGIDCVLKAESIKDIEINKLKESLKSFKDYYEKAANIFFPDKLLLNGNKWRRALLTKGDYLLDQRRNYSFIINTFDRDISWKRLLNNGNRKFIKELIDDLAFLNKDKELEQVIDKYLLNDENYRNDWYYYFIKYPELISREFCGNNLYIRYVKDDEIYLLKSSRTSGRIREYYTAALFLELKDKLVEKNISITCEATTGINNPNYLIFSKKDIENIFIEYRSGWYYKFDEEDEGIKIEQDELIRFLEKEGYIKNIYK